MQAISYSDTRANLKSVMDRVCADKIAVTVTRQKAEGVVMVSQSEWESMQETLYLLSSPKNAEHLLEAIAELDAGGGEEHELIKP
ncbi:type II toxin-antitoxin system prevent-host-death family antitoxin [Pacificimonas sp. WHA3]|uniref:Antitoxin n=1 Tax=Pacificimonas pallii TaxID=2827236 RepID=A0ABS6SGH1_9SPHN|nr:type II toxin-antitoxin system prevent-host-death family antitoxin [Pacificimonas pallii]MBV7257510.1 type II toxin-antitoxin system prevent-host-death family antitoxin [Pacificimonas pallii]